MTRHGADDRPRTARRSIRGWFGLYLTQMRIAILSQIQYRVANYFYMIGMVAEPVIYLVVWSTVARQQGGEVGGFTPGDVRRVLHRLDAGPEHEHRLHAVRLGGAGPRGRARRDAPAADPPDPLRPRPTSPAGRSS